MKHLLWFKAALVWAVILMTLVYSQPVQAANFQEILYSLRNVSASDAEQGQEEDADADDPDGGRRA